MGNIFRNKKDKELIKNDNLIAEDLLKFYDNKYEEELDKAILNNKKRKYSCIDEIYDYTYIDGIQLLK